MFNTLLLSFCWIQPEHIKLSVDSEFLRKGNTSAELLCSEKKLRQTKKIIISDISVFTAIAKCKIDIFLPFPVIWKAKCITLLEYAEWIRFTSKSTLASSVWHALQFGTFKEFYILKRSTRTSYVKGWHLRCGATRLGYQQFPIKIS